MIEKVRELINEKPGYLKKSPSFIAKLIEVEDTYNNVLAIKSEMKRLRKQASVNDIKAEVFNYAQEKEKLVSEVAREDINESLMETLKLYMQEGNLEGVLKVSEIIKNLEVKTKIKTKAIKEKDETVLVIGDIHEPFTLDGYLEFCKEQYDKFNCTKVVFIGDIVDNAFSSFHPTNPDGYGAGDELDRAIAKISKWYEAFPNATVIIGNHDRLAYRKAFTGGISSRWIRTYNDVLNTPNWSFEEKEIINGVLYIHGEAGTARSKAKDISMSTVQGHLHSQAYVEFVNNRVFAMQVGTGVDDTQYAFNYNKAGKESILSCGIVINGIQPILIKM